MTKSEKIRKLGNAVIAYRGIRQGVEGPWVFLPQKTSIEKMKLCLARAGVLTTENLSKIDGFKSQTEMHQWLNSL